MKKLATAAIVLLSACAPQDAYKQPPEDAKAAYLSGFNQTGGALSPQWMYARPHAVDSKFVDYGISSDITDSSLLVDGNVQMRVTPGAHTVTIFSEFNNAFFGQCPCSAYNSVKATFVAGKHYEIRTSVQDATVKNWIIDTDSKAKISTIGSGNYVMSPREITAFLDN